MKHPVLGCLVWFAIAMLIASVATIVDETTEYGEVAVWIVWLVFIPVLGYVMYKRMAVNQEYRDRQHPERKGAKRRNEYRDREASQLMALIQCPECNGQVSDKAVACPHCGFPLPTPNEPVEADPASIDNPPLSEPSPETEPATNQPATASRTGILLWILAGLSFLLVAAMLIAYAQDDNVASAPPVTAPSTPHSGRSTRLWNEVRLEPSILDFYGGSLKQINVDALAQEFCEEAARVGTPDKFNGLLREEADLTRLTNYYLENDAFGVIIKGMNHTNYCATELATSVISGAIYDIRLGNG